MSAQEPRREVLLELLSQRLDDLEREASEIRRTVNTIRRAAFRGAAVEADADADAGAELRAKRLELGLSQREAARSANISRSQVCSLELGQRVGRFTLPVYRAALERLGAAG